MGWATQADAVLYLNVKGAVTTPGKRTASILAGVFFVAIVAAVILAMVASSKGGGNGGSGIGRAAGAFRAGRRSRARRRAAVAGAGRRAACRRRRGARRSGRRAARRFPWVVAAGVEAGPRRVSCGARRSTTAAARIGIGVGVIVPLGGPVHTHDGNVDYDDPMFAGDELYVSMTLVSTYDGRVLWHARDHVDREADHPEHIDEADARLPRHAAPRPPPRALSSGKLQLVTAGGPMRRLAVFGVAQPCIAGCDAAA